MLANMISNLSLFREDWPDRKSETTRRQAELLEKMTGIKIAGRDRGVTRDSNTVSLGFMPENARVFPIWGNNICPDGSMLSKVCAATPGYPGKPGNYNVEITVKIKASPVESDPFLFVFK